MTVPEVPFTVDADLDLDEAAARWLRPGCADVVIRRGAVPESLPEVEHGGRFWSAAQGRFLVNAPHGLRILVEGGERIRYEAPGLAADEVRPFLQGSAWAALACQRGLLCLHASAVACADGVHAFTGASRDGKSTLAGALSMRGYPFFSDDVLTFAPLRFGEEVRCCSHQDMKLHPDAMALLGARIQRPVDRKAEDGKVHALPRQRWPHVSASLKALYVLKREQRPAFEQGLCTVERLSGVQALNALLRAVFRPKFTAAILGRGQLFQQLAVLQSQVGVFRFHRPFTHEWFDRGVACIAEALPARPLPAMGCA